MKQPQYLMNAARLLRARLDPLHPGFRGDDGIKSALSSAGPYLESYVYPLIVALQRGTAPQWLKDTILRDAANLSRAERKANESSVR